MYIEIIDRSQHCPVKCTTCPDSIRKLAGEHADKIPIVFSSIVEKLHNYPLNVSFVNYAGDVVSKIEQYGIINPAMLTCPLPITTDACTDESVVRRLHQMLPTTRLHFGFTNKNNTITKKMFDKAVMLGNFFKETNLPLVKLSITDNTCSPETYAANMIAYLKSDMILHERLARELNVPLKARFSYEKDRACYFSHAQHGDRNRAFLLTRRVMVEVPSNTDEDFFAFAYAYEKSGQISDPEKLYLTLTPMGVRLNHIAWDIKNPYLWISYDEMMVLLEKSSTIEVFCALLARHIKMGLVLNLGNDFQITQENIERKAVMQSKQFNLMV